MCVRMLQPTTIQEVSYIAVCINIERHITMRLLVPLRISDTDTTMYKHALSDDMCISSQDDSLKNNSLIASCVFFRD